MHMLEIALMQQHYIWRNHFFRAGNYTAIVLKHHDATRNLTYSVYMYEAMVTTE